jgi:hypothetical protein
VGIVACSLSAIREKWFVIRIMAVEADARRGDKAWLSVSVFIVVIEVVIRAGLAFEDPSIGGGT